MITKIEEKSDLEEFGFDLISFRVYLRKPDGTDVNTPLTVYMWEIMKFINIHDHEAAAYVNKISEGLCCQGPKDGKILKVLHQNCFPIHSFVEKYVKSLPDEKINKHITWAENREVFSDGDYEFNTSSHKQRRVYLPKLWMRWYGK